MWKQKNKMNFNLTSIKTAKSRNGFSMTAKFWINGIYVADFMDKGDGSQPDLCILCNAEALKLAAIFDDQIELLPPVYLAQFDCEIKLDQYLFIDLLHAAIVEKQDFKLLENATAL